MARSSGANLGHDAPRRKIRARTPTSRISNDWKELGGGIETVIVAALKAETLAGNTATMFDLPIKKPDYHRGSRAS
ncbi:MAG: hypothetical protein CMM07_24975 [Rhodopirellula sp.]|nr:hypothetical protein [Rhodopirellula sp.]